MVSGTPSRHTNTCDSHYYQVPFTDLEGEWVRAYHGTYFYVLWNILISGFLGSGLRGEGGDTHMVEAGVVYTTPNPNLAYRYACPHQLFGNGFLYKVVLDLRVMKDRMYKSFNANGSKQFSSPMTCASQAFGYSTIPMPRKTTPESLSGIRSSKRYL